MTTIRVYYKGKWKVFVLIRGRVPDYAIIDMAMAINADPTIPHDHVAIVDELNDEILWDTRHDDTDEEECFEPGRPYISMFELNP